MAKRRLYDCKPLLVMVLVLLRLPTGAEAHDYVDPRLVRKIMANEPYLLIDDYFVDNRFNEDQISARVPHVLQSGERLSAPVMRHDPDLEWEQHGVGYASVVFDSLTQKFRLYYQIWNPRNDDRSQPRGGYRTCYAESEDGIAWHRPLFDFEQYGTSERTNILMSGEGGAKAPHVIPSVERGETRSGVRVKNLGMLPQEVLQGNPYLMFYCDQSHYLATSEDGLNWREQQSKLIPNRVDCFQSVVYASDFDEYAIYYRNKLIYADRPKDDL